MYFSALVFINYECGLNLFIVKVYIIDSSESKQKNIKVDLSDPALLKIEEAVM